MSLPRRHPHTRLALIAFANILSLIALPSAEAQTTTTPSEAQPMPTAAELIRQIQQAESWVDDVKTFDIDLEVQWTVDHKGEKKPPGRVRIAFDDRRLYYRDDGVDSPGSYYMRVWDGKVSIDRHNRNANLEYCSYSPKLQAVMLCFGYLPWLRAAPYPFWFADKGEIRNPLGAAEEWELAGDKDINGVSCYVLDRPGGEGTCHRLYVGKSDRRLYGQIRLRLPDAAQERGLELVREFAAAEGTRLETTEQIGAWVQRQPEAKQADLLRRLARAMRTEMAVVSEHWTLDYRKVMPGRWAPMRMWYSILGSGGRVQRCDLRVIRLDTDRPLNDSLFAPDLALTEKVQIHDYTRNPPLTYMHKPSFTSEEWKQIEEQAAKEQRR